MTKKVALLIPHHFNMFEVIVKNLEINNYHVELLIITDYDFRYKNWVERASSLFQKINFKNKAFKSQLRIQRHSELLEESLRNVHSNFDYTLVIRPDHFSTKSLQLLKEKSQMFTAYQWDGFKRYPGIIDYIALFDRFFVFDNDDYRKYHQQYKNMFPITNFYIDYWKKGSVDKGNGVFFLGSYLEERIDDVIGIANFFEKQNIATNIQIVYNRSTVPDKLKNSNIKILPSAKKYAEMLEEIKRSKYLLEFQNTDIHNGLSFRVFEAICFKKKLITNNADVKNYDFYHPNNIFIWENHDYEKIISFLEEEYVDIDSKIYEKYGFTNWINYIFDRNSYKNFY